MGFWWCFVWRKVHTSQNCPWAPLFWRQSIYAASADQEGPGWPRTSASWVLELKVSTAVPVQRQLGYCIPLFRSRPLSSPSPLPLYLPPFLPSTVSLRQESSLYKPRLPQTQNSPASTITCWYYRSMPLCQLVDFFWINVCFWLFSQNNADLFVDRQCQLNEYIPISSESTNCSGHLWHLKSSQELSTPVLYYLKILPMYSHSLLPQSMPRTISKSMLFGMHKTIIWALNNPSLTTVFVSKYLTTDFHSI